MPTDDLVTRIAVLEQQLKGAEHAVMLQAKEYERRLLELNHAHDRAVQDRATYVTREMFASFQDKIESSLDSIRESRSQDSGHKRGVGDAWKFVVAAVGLISTLALLLDAYRLFLLRS